jgi:hypothetical protein
MIASSSGIPTSMPSLQNRTTQITNHRVYADAGMTDNVPLDYNKLTTLEFF